MYYHETATPCAIINLIIKQVAGDQVVLRAPIQLKEVGT